MEKNDKDISINLQIGKNIHDGRLSLQVVFDTNAENFCMDDNGVTWSPTFEEIDFIVEAFSVLSHKKNMVREESHNTETVKTPPKEESFASKDETHNEEVCFEHEQTTEEQNDSAACLKNAKVPPKAGNKIFVPASSQAIDEALKRKKEEEEIDDDFIVEASEKAILDKVLKHKKKKR